MKYEAIIGLEVHAQLSTQSKIFCGCAVQFGGAPNTQGCPVCLGMPGVLPVLNKKGVESTLRAALAVDGEIMPRSRFLRKNYFYPDLPKGYQISQYQSHSEDPLSVGGRIEIEVDGGKKTIRLIRIHMEEDAGKSVHEEAYVAEDESLFDVNRCGVPLIEIVSEPDLRTPEEAYAYLVKLRQILIYLGVCEGNMEEGNVRTDANVSIRYEKDGQMVGTAISEIKNMNSFRNAQKAIEAAIARQIEMVEDGEKVTKETLLFDAGTGTVRLMRSKEEAHDYRYFPEPDLVPIEVDRAWIEEIRSQLPEMPHARRTRFIRDYKLPEYDAGILTSTRQLANYYERCLSYGVDPKLASNWVMGDVLRELKDATADPSDFPVSPDHLAKMLNMITEGTISGKIAKTIFEEMIKTEDDPEKIVRKKGLVQITDESVLEEAIDDALAAHPAEVAQYRTGRKKLLGFFMGQIMKATKGKANPKLVNQMLRRKLDQQ